MGLSSITIRRAMACSPPASMIVQLSQIGCLPGPPYQMASELLVIATVTGFTSRWNQSHTPW